MNLYLDGSWLGCGIGGTGVRRFSAELNAAMLDLLAWHRAPVVARVFSIARPVEPAYRRPGIAYPVLFSAYRPFLWANACFGAPDVLRRLDPAADAVHLHDPVRLSGRSAGRVVVTVHDLAALREPSAYPARAVWLRRRSLERLRRSEAIVHAVSESTRADLLAIGRLPAARVHVVPEGVSPRFFAPIPAAERAARCRRLGLDRPFFVALGAQHPRKNLGFLLRCFRDLLRAGRYDVLLALIGPGSSAHVDDLCRRAGYEPGERARVRHLGPLSDEAVRTCLQHSLGLVFPSLYEGFGLPVLEAMASGTPVIASDRSSLPEVVGDCGILLDPGRSEPWVAAMAALLEKPAAARALAARAQIRARRFTWTAAARRLLALLEVPLA